MEYDDFPLVAGFSYIAGKKKRERSGLDYRGIGSFPILTWKTSCAYLGQTVFFLPDGKNLTLRGDTSVS